MLSLTAPHRTRAHGWPAGAKLGALACATILLFALDSPAAMAGAFAATLALYLTGGVTFARAGLRRLWPLWPFVAILLAWHGIDGNPALGALLALRLVTAVALATLVTMTTPLSDMVALVQWLATPLRRMGLNTRPAALALALVLRFVPSLTMAAGRLRQSWRARSARKGPSWRILGPLAVHALDDAEQVALALRARGGLIEGTTSDGT
ncbi:biotin transport system permease protein [Palleronia salina]|uniref:Biotin transport system permease protein n=1 Tax=Palleronia salina TaxID=313368 RepID=A0A1M6EPU4_9RHOB|nr:energy-coupling factor transporter transmembrane protein EcfT [Palleronia salina]SHI87494.1 biotin transport system permease protein [Palleronia salina]